VINKKDDICGLLQKLKTRFICTQTPLVLLILANRIEEREGTEDE
jgi:hypothetical protein